MKNIIKKFIHLVRDELKINQKKTIYEMFEEEENIKCYNYFKKYFKTSIFLDPSKIREYAIKESLNNNKPDEKIFNIEFGVYKGESINFFSNFVDKIYGFDSFEGLKEDWVGASEPRGEFKLEKIPKLNNNVIPIVGIVQNTLEDFLNKHKPKISFVHMDLDTYESSKFVLSKIKPYLIDKSIILFDELYNFPGWDVGELKALNEIFGENEVTYKAFSITKSRVVIQVRSI